MATPLSIPFLGQIPVTPPPDHQIFGKAPIPPPQVPRTFMQQANTAMGSPLREPVRPQSSHAPVPGGSPQTQNHQNVLDPAFAGDPKYLAMASRIASYYQQRCQAISNFQQQRCQAWANMHRQKCQEMTQAAMLVVAWYIRDRISRRKRRQKRAFKRGLSEKVARAPPMKTKGESVRRWVMGVPSPSGSNNNAVDAAHDKPLDIDEIDFEMDKESTPDKDAKLFNVADNLIKSQLAKIDVPLLGVLSFDPSDSEKEEEEYEEEEYEYSEEMEEYDGDYDDEYDDGDHEEEKQYNAAETTGSNEVHPGTTEKGTGKRTRSSVS
ncbi:hypothetical protein QBC46DRAFT_286044 [Diplogelasinospora grovesii]|uniref:Uncharacterized protein n=1 Tax=Diplogelasinospora grovesii TaxID=303347 RepID=A0AAN6N999_9PEZI|nr:hypothetical protein QBC46DRAFT_286044 [Diplogelasinospora grovesii]